MPEPLALTCLGKIGVAILGNVGGYLFAPIQQQFKYMCCFNSNITELETQLKKLETTKEGVQLRVDEDLRNVRIIAPDVKNWLERANEVTPEVEGIIQDKAKVKEGCLNGWCPNLKLRYSLSRKAVEKTKVVVGLKADGVSYTKPSYRPQPACMETIPNGDFTGFESRRLVMEEIIKALKNDEINLIGVCGMGGVGKTTLVKEVANRAKEEKLFDEVAFVAVGQNPDITKVQNSIADIFGLNDLKTKDDATTRASLLRRRLSQDNKKILLILDDIWAEFNLEDHGIPLGGSHETFKIIYTSRFRGIWHDVPNKKEIPLELLSEDEAWQLFRDKAGDSADAKDLQPIAKQIANECGRLPLALVLIGSALSKKIGRNDIKEMWEDMLNRLICATSTPADGRLYSRLELSYQFLEDEEAKRLFLLCCLFQEDKDIRIEDLARYGLGLSLFEGINEMRKARCRVVALVYDLKSRYLLLNSKEEECVKVHDVVRDMGISIASKNKSALVIHGEVSEWPNKDTYEHYTFISLISTKITELPKGLTCPNLEFLLLDCRKLKELPSNFFEGMGKLKVLVLNNFKGILSLPSSLRNLHTLSLEGFHDMLDNVSVIGDLLNLEILSFCSLYIEELPEEIGKLVNLRLLDMRYTTLRRIPSGVISRLICLEELYIGTTFKDWEGEGEEQEGRNANLREFESLSHLNTVEICIRAEVLIPKAPIFSKLKMYKVLIDNSGETSSGNDKYKKQLEVSASNLFPSNHEEIYSLLRSSDYVRLSGKGCNDLVRELLLRDGVDGLQKLKSLAIDVSDTPECLANTLNLVQQKPNVAAPDPVVFPILEKLNLYQLHNLGEICHGPVPAGSFGELTDIRVYGCGRLENLFQLPIVGCLTQLKKLIITHCDMMEEVIWKEQREDVNVATNIIAFPKLDLLELDNLPSLVGFCRGIDQIDFPQLKTLSLGSLEQVNRLFDNNSNLSSNLEQQNDDVAVLSLFPQKVTFPNLENLELRSLENVSDRLSSELPAFQFSKLKKLEVKGCVSFKNLFHPSMAGVLVNLRTLKLINCWNMEAVVDWEVEIEDGRGREVEKTIFPQLMELQLRRLPKLSRFCHFTHPIELPQLSKVDILDCPIMDSISLGRVRTPSLSLPGISWNGDLNSAVQPLKEKRTKKEEKRQKRLHDLFPDGTWGNLLHHALGTIQRGANDGDDMRHNNSARIRGGTDPQNSES